MSDRPPLADVIDGAPWAFVASSGTNTAPVALLSGPVLDERLGRRSGLREAFQAPEVLVFVDRDFLNGRRLGFDDGDTLVETLGHGRRLRSTDLDAVVQRVRFTTRTHDWPAHEVTVAVVKGMNAEVYAAVAAEGPPEVLAGVLDGCTGFGGQRGWPHDNGCENALLARGLGGGVTLADVPRWIVTDHLKHAITPAGGRLQSPSERQAPIRHDDIIGSTDASFPFQLRARERLTGGGRSGCQKWGHPGPLGGVWLFEVEARDAGERTGSVGAGEWSGYEGIGEGPWLPFARLLPPSDRFRSTRTVLGPKGCCSR